MLKHKFAAATLNEAGDARRKGDKTQARLGVQFAREWRLSVSTSVLKADRTQTKAQWKARYSEFRKTWGV